MVMLVLDAETTSNAPKPHFGATPHWPGNSIHMLGHRDMTGDRADEAVSLVTSKGGILTADVTVFVGHNVKFDLLHLCRQSRVAPRVLLKTATVWDTMTADYVLSGQRDHGRSLEECCTRAGIPFTKDPSVVSHFEAGKGADTLDPDVCQRYLVGDVEATEELALSQMSQMSDNQLTLMTAMMEMEVATIEMEHNGLPWDPYSAADVSTAQQNLCDQHARDFCAQADVWAAVNKLAADETMALGLDENSTFADATNPTVLGKLLFAEELTWSAKEAALTKTGKTRVRRVKKSRKVTPTLSQLWSRGSADLTPTGDFALHEKAFEKILAEGVVHPSFDGKLDLKALLNAYAEFKAGQKIQSTYIDGVSQYVIDGKVHCNYNLAVTRTGRLSCSNPNLQNPPPIAKGCYVAPDGWKFLEIDYKQIEVVGLALLSGDKQLLQDIQMGRDIHTELYYEMYGRKPSSDERKAFKPLTFGLIYGAGNRTLAANSGQPKSVVIRFRDTFFRRYPAVKTWYEFLAQEARKHRVPTEAKAVNGLPLGEFVYSLPTGRKLVFKEGLVPWDPRQTNFSPADLANWPVQSFATADIVPTMVGVLMRRLWGSEYAEDALLVCTTHDSVGLLVREKALDNVWVLCYKVLSRTSQIFGDMYKLLIECPLDITATVGTTWKECGDDANKLAPPTI